MSHEGKVQLTLIVIAPPELAAEGEQLFEAHAVWIETTHERSGDKALLSYTVSKGPELAEPMNPESEATGNVCFVLTEVYETQDGILDHFEKAGSTWKEWPAFGDWIEKCGGATMIPSARIIQSLW